MSEEREVVNEQKVSVDFWPIAIILWIIFFWGEPDIHGAIIFWLTTGGV